MIVDNDDLILRKRHSRISDYNDPSYYGMEARKMGTNEDSADAGAAYLNLPTDGTGFRCITCKRGPPYTKKYAKN